MRDYYLIYLIFNATSILNILKDFQPINDVVTTEIKAKQRLSFWNPQLNSIDSSWNKNELFEFF